jgi:hypothetical protein
VAATAQLAGGTAGVTTLPAPAAVGEAVTEGRTVREAVAAMARTAAMAAATAAVGVGVAAVAATAADRRRPR